MEVINNEKKQQFELEINEDKAVIDYDLVNGKIRLNYTEVPESMKGKGIGSKLAEQTFALIERMGKKVIPECEFIQHWLEKNPDKKRLIADMNKG